METQSVSSLEEDVTREVDSDDDDSDDLDFRPRICIRLVQYPLPPLSVKILFFVFISHSFSNYNRTGGALKTQICLESLQEISMEDTVHDAPANAPDPTTSDTPTPAEAAKVLVEEDIIGHPASIAYHDSLRQLAESLLLPVNMCSAKDPNRKVECCAPGPFEINVRSRGTAAIIEWVSLHLAQMIIRYVGGLFFCLFVFTL